MSNNKVKQLIIRQVLEQVPEIHELDSRISSAFLILLQKSLDCLDECHEKEIQSLKQQLADAEKVIGKSRAKSSYSTVKWNQDIREYKSKYQVSDV